MTYLDYLTRKCVRDLGLLPDGGPAEDEQNTFVNSRDDVRILKIREMDAWYASNDSGLLNFYTKNNLIDFNYEPLYWRNKQSYFWAVSSTENDYKRTTSGLAEAIVDSIVNLVGYPTIGDPELKASLEETGFDAVFHDTQMVKTLVEGYAGYRIDWDLSLSQHPFVSCYSAENVDFIVKRNFLVGMVFKDWYADERGQKYLVCETRHFANRIDDKKIRHRDLLIETDCFRANFGGSQVQLDLISEPSSVPCLRGVSDGVRVSDCPYLLAEPCVFFPDPENLSYGRGILQSKVSLLDDLDQSLSQSANTDRASTPEKIYDTNYLERDSDGLPKQPKCFDKKYTYVAGPRDSSGATQNVDPVKVIQPVLNFEQYSSEQINIATHILQGVLSPATLGIDISRKDNANAQREKEKVTVFTRNAIIVRETVILKKLLSQYMIVDGYLRTGSFVCQPHDVPVKFSEFADESFENKLDALVTALAQKAISPEMFVSKLYGDSLTDDQRKQEVDWLHQNFDPQQEQPQGGPMAALDGGPEPVPAPDQAGGGMPQ
jgi:hypothetical protein